jgi:serine/threonine protein kinase
VHRDVKPSNLLLAQPFFLRSTTGVPAKGRGRSMSRHEAAAARWALSDLGSAALLQPAWRWEASAGLLPRLQWEAGGEPPYETPAYSPPEVRLGASGRAREARITTLFSGLEPEAWVVCLHTIHHPCPPSCCPPPTAPFASGHPGPACHARVGHVVPWLHPI